MPLSNAIGRVQAVELIHLIQMEMELSLLTFQRDCLEAVAGHWLVERWFRLI